MRLHLERFSIGAAALCYAASTLTGSAAPARNFPDLVRNDISTLPATDRTISKAQAEADLDDLRSAIENRNSYQLSVAFPVEDAIAAIKAHLPDTVSTQGLALQVHKLVQNLGDNHAQVSNWTRILPGRYSPVRFGVTGKLVFAYWPDRRELIDPAHPYIRSIDGIPVGDWLAKAGDSTSGKMASASQRLARGLDLMRYVGYLRSELGIKDSENLDFELVSADGRSLRRVSVPVVTELAAQGKHFGLPNESRMLPGNVGYLRIHSQGDKKLTATLDGLMKQFRDTDALIIDARQCGGGTRDNLQTLFPYFMKESDPPYIFNVAKLRIPGDATSFDPIGKLDVDDKKMPYRGDPGAPEDQKAALEAFLKDFRPQWQPPAGKFTDWYHMPLTAVPGKPYYGKKVYFLMDWGVGSAGDIFVSAFKGWRNVTLIGTPSNGRSGNSLPFELRNSRVVVQLSTMASFQKTGEQYDGVGIRPDIPMEATLDDWLSRSDSLLDRVHKMALEGAKP